MKSVNVEYNSRTCFHSFNLFISELYCVRLLYSTVHTHRTSCSSVPKLIAAEQGLPSALGLVDLFTARWYRDRCRKFYWPENFSIAYHLLCCISFFSLD